MTELEKLCEQALYEEIQDLGDGKSIVRDVPTGRLFYRKVLAVYNTQVFAFLKDHKSRYVPRVESFREEGKTLIVIEEFVQGRTLENILDDESASVSFQERIRILTELCDGLSFLHNAQPPIIHRDLKASNVMLTEDGVVKIIDYDAAKIFISGEKKDTVLMGTHGVAAPEQYGFAASDVRTDIFALGKLIERMLPENADAARIVTKATHIDPKKRYASAAQIREQIVRIREQASSLDTCMEKVIPGFDPRRKGHRLLGRAAIVVFCAAILLGAAFAVWRLAVYPEQRRAAMRAELGTLQSEEVRNGETADSIEEFLSRYPYEKMTGEEQFRFRNSMEELLAGYINADDKKKEILSVLSDECGEEAAQTVAQYAETEKLLGDGAYEKVFSTLSPLRESGALDAEEKWTEALSRCMKKALSLEESYKQDGNLSTARLSMKHYAMVISRGDEKQGGEARESYDRLFQEVLGVADTCSENGEYESAEEQYELLKDCQDTEKSAQTDLEERIRANTYRKAESFFAEKNYSTAGRVFSELEDYSDAAARAQLSYYLQGEENLKQENYKEAAGAFELCPGYEDADTKLLEARYSHCESVCEKPDDTAYTWIGELVDAGYPGAEAVRDTMYEWHAEIQNGIGLLVGSQQSSHIRVYLYGGRPGASTRIRLETIDNVTGARSQWTSSEECSRGGHVDAGYNVNSYEYSIFEREHTINAYDSDGNRIGSWTGVFSMEFLSD